MVGMAMDMAPPRCRRPPVCRSLVDSRKEPARGSNYRARLHSSGAARRRGSCDDGRRQRAADRARHGDTAEHRDRSQSRRRPADGRRPARGSGRAQGRRDRPHRSASISGAARAGRRSGGERRGRPQRREDRSPAVPGADRPGRHPAAAARHAGGDRRSARRRAQERPEPDRRARS